MHCFNSPHKRIYKINVCEINTAHIFVVGEHAGRGEGAQSFSEFPEKKKLSKPPQ